MTKLLCFALCALIGALSLVCGAETVFGNGERAIRSREKRQNPAVLPDSGLTDDDKQEILEAHVAMRESVGTSAGNLLAIEYSDELASLAQLTASSCKFVEDNTILPSTNEEVGQVIFYNGNTSHPGPPIQEQFAVEQAAYDYDTNTCQTGQTCNNFKQIAWYTTSKIGCGKKFCPLMLDANGLPILKDGALVVSQFFWVCNYQEIAVQDERPYLESNKPCSLCNLEPGTICERNQCRTCNPDTDLACRRPDVALCVEDRDQCCTSWDFDTYCNPGSDRYSYMSTNCGAWCEIYLCGTV